MWGSGFPQNGQNLKSKSFPQNGQKLLDSTASALVSDAGAAAGAAAGVAAGALPPGTEGNFLVVLTVFMGPVDAAADAAGAAAVGAAGLIADIAQAA